MSIVTTALITMLCSVAAPAETPAPGTQGRYRVLSCSTKKAPPFEAVKILYGPPETVDGRDSFNWQLSVHETEHEAVPLCVIRILSSHDPLASTGELPAIYRYQLHIPETDETYEYRNVHTNKALLPAWKDFTRYFIPHRAKASRSQNNMANTAEYLGHVLTLRGVDTDVSWQRWSNVKTLTLNPELLIGTARDFREKEDGRLPQEPEKQDYTYIPYTPEDYRVMIDTGTNIFFIKRADEKYLRGEPVFYHLRRQRKPFFRYPADLYRSNYLGPTMFMDEPTIILTGDEHINTVLRYWSDFAATIKGRVHSRYMSSKHYGAYNLEGDLERQGINLGDMRLMQYDFPTWETYTATAFYQMEGGCNGLVQEGRFDLDEFTQNMNRWLGENRTFTPEQYLRCEFATIRGGTRPFDKYWGTAIYGQADPKLSPLAVTLAYDMGARYVWFWTSDHDHHLPWREQMELTRHLRTHAANTPRRSLAIPSPERDLAIVLPYGYFLWFGHEDDNPHANLWWIRELDVLEHDNESSIRYHRLMTRAVRAITEALDQHLDFDITIDDGREITGYKRIVRITDE